ncbi:ICOS ligand, partial [Galemys pyrenaicus]
STDAQRQELRALVGSDVELGCSHRQAGDFDLRDLYVYWQAGGPNGTLSVACHLGDSSQCQEAQYPDPEYRHRARLEPERMRRGDFSLILRRVGPQDEQAFRCVVLRNSLGMDRVVDTTVSLHVAANFSMPVVHASRGPAPGELTFTCVSTDGYPRPKVHWINRTDGSALDQALHNSSVTRNVRGLYDVVSVLRLSRTGRVDVGCCVENDRLCQNLTVGGWAGGPGQRAAAGRAGGRGAAVPAQPRPDPPPGLLGEALPEARLCRPGTRPRCRCTPRPGGCGCCPALRSGTRDSGCALIPSPRREGASPRRAVGSSGARRLARPVILPPRQPSPCPDPRPAGSPGLVPLGRFGRAQGLRDAQRPGVGRPRLWAAGGACRGPGRAAVRCSTGACWPLAAGSCRQGTRRPGVGTGGPGAESREGLGGVGVDALTWTWSGPTPRESPAPLLDGWSAAGFKGAGAPTAVTSGALRRRGPRGSRGRGEGTRPVLGGRGVWADGPAPSVTAPLSADVPTPEGSRHTEGPPPEHSSGSSASSALAVAVPLAVALAAGVAVGCTCRSRLLRGRYAGTARRSAVGGPRRQSRLRPPLGAAATRCGPGQAARAVWGLTLLCAARPRPRRVGRWLGSSLWGREARRLGLLSGAGGAGLGQRSSGCPVGAPRPG